MTVMKDIRLKYQIAVVSMEEASEVRKVGIVLLPQDPEGDWPGMVNDDDMLALSAP